MADILRAVTRRDMLVGLVVTTVTACAHDAGAPAANATGPASEAAAARELAAIEASVGGRVGVFALDTGSGRSLAQRADERFAMCSTFKWVVAAAVLARGDRGELSLDQRIPYGETDLLDHAPVASEHVAEGALPVETLLRAVLTVSDNTAANLLLAQAGGPAGVTAFVRRAGDAVTRVDRTEPTCNTNEPGDPRDTTSPRAMVGLLKAVLCGDVLKPASRDRLLDWMKACETGKKRLRAGLPGGWVIGDRTGTGENNAVNDVAIVVPPGRAPILVAVYMSEGRDEDDGAIHEGGHARVARLVAKEMG
ncbi:MAG TPA: class A beta-lactamase [Polyangiaceae bacterium]|jgi:beta-lactamase class A